MSPGNRLKQLRQEKGRSQDELAFHAHIDRRQISRYERNQSTPSVEALKILAKIFGVSTDFLLFDDIDKMALGDIHDPELLNQFRELDRLDNVVRGKARFLLEAILTQQQVQQIATKAGARH